jgi:hypothetical protein
VPTINPNIEREVKKRLKELTKQFEDLKQQTAAAP